MMGLADFNLTPKAKKGLKDSKKFAKDNGHDLVTVAHLVYGCLSNISDTCSLRLKSYDIDFDIKLFEDIFQKYAKKDEYYFLSKKGQGGWHNDVNEMIKSAKDFSDMFDSYFIGIEHILYVILDSDNDFIRFLSKNSIDLLLAKDLIEGYILEDSIPPLDQMKGSFISDTEELIDVEDLQSPLPNISKYSINLNEKYLSKKSATISGRDSEIYQLVETLRS